jgi:hypothetical protein
VAGVVCVMGCVVIRTHLMLHFVVRRGSRIFRNWMMVVMIGMMHACVIFMILWMFGH